MKLVVPWRLIKVSYPKPEGKTVSRVGFRDENGNKECTYCRLITGDDNDYLGRLCKPCYRKVYGEKAWDDYVKTGWELT